ncbi:dihydroceramide delta-4 desaturase [Coccidioides immitis RMSCC 3703]|uniref:Dihydroceramide delta-4 desaturase n=1 Tax=Coccidioides immitis RMSCC 3703 TaxID=454286 RepID=A0A0J8QIZ7_COCIT|nr:dihydroceramide delta-4 desaturase [Coccidioides immitis RMSCC 3703]
MSALRSASARSQSSQTKTVPARAPPPSNSSVEDHFFWTYTEEPHKSRRQAIIKAHPEASSHFRLPAQPSYVIRRYSHGVSS